MVGEFQYCAIIGDIIKSRDISERESVQSLFESAIETVNAKFHQAIASKLAITLGDEFQGLIKDFSAIIDILNTLEESIYPIKFVYGLGKGSLTTKLVPQAIGMDGQCFHYAREALEQGKLRGNRVLCKGFGDSIDFTLNALFKLMFAIRDGWTARQFEVIRELRCTPKKMDVAKKFNVVPSNISAILSAASWDAVHMGEQAIKSIFTSL